jgi:glycosyltransferase involved in cell wall biosynthesis
MGQAPHPEPGPAPETAAPSRPDAPPTDPDVAVVVTSHDEGGLIADCIAGLRTQTWQNWECVVMDDHSTDDTVERALEAIDGDPRFSVVVSDRNSGPSMQRNAGVLHSRAPLVAFLDADDFYYPRAIEIRLEVLRRDPHPARAGAFCNWVDVAASATPGGDPPRKRGRPRVTWLKGGDVQGVPFILSAPLIDRRALLAVGGFRTLPVSVDVDLWQRMLRAGFYFDSVREVGVVYRHRHESFHRRSVVRAASDIAAMVATNAYPLDDPGVVGPYVFTEPFYSYGPRLLLARRLVRAAAFELAAGRDAGDVIDAFAGHFEPWMEWMLPMGKVVASTSRLAALAHDGEGVVASDLADRLEVLLAPFTRRGLETAGAWLDVSVDETALEVGPAVRREIS